MTRYFVLFLVLMIGSQCHNSFAQSDIENQKAVKTLYFKKKWSVKNRLLKIKYSFYRKERKPQLDFSKWTLTFEDQFDSINRQKWRLGQAWGVVHPENLHQYYDDSSVHTKDGYLILDGSYKPKQIFHNNQWVNVPYAIGLVNTDISFKQKYGYFEIRSKNPKGPATWPAFWLTGAHKWPPEIDIFEMYGRKNGKHIHNQYMSLHWGKSNTKSRDFMAHKVKLPNDTDSNFHIYGCLWEKHQISFYTDHHLVCKIRLNKRLQKLMDEEMVVILNNCFEAKYLPYLPPNFKSNQFIVDYIKVYSIY